MSDCQADRPAPLRCPTFAEVLESALALLPRGRAWQSNEGGPVKGFDPAFDPAAFPVDYFASGYRKGSTLRRFWASVASVFTFVNTRLCDLRWEFWCATQKETNDLWMAEYGLPDDCDPFPDLCTKVAALGGTRCEYYQAIAARAGWTIECLDAFCGSLTGCALSGVAQTGRPMQAAKLFIRVDLDSSPAYAAPARTVVPMSGRYLSGAPNSCNSPPADISPLQCLLERIVHAEIQIEYEVI
jgi:hypothetical protein